MSALAETGDAPSLQRARGRVAASVTASGGPLRLGRLHQSGCLKLRFPRLADRSLEGVLINTAGGLTGGDRVEQAYAVGEGAALTVTTQAAERIYRASADEARVLSRLEVAEAATLAFLPQETILFDGGRLRRRLEVDLAASSRLLLCESVILGRTLMGETVRDGLIHDSWRVRRDGRLVFAEELRLGGAIDRLAAGPATLAGHRAFATLLVQDPAAEALLGEARALLPAAGGASLVAGLLVLRLAAPTGFELRRRLVPLIAALAKRPLPRVWSL
ncbi:urease accessory protein UreD [Aureimonas endophytica]|uniref:Urease accessory protein UreD n=1 Tax=Aureimonas endophytica TaxID=2027858 RepID=A0A917A061_9HYPH|nr:urease accessory protein UreD [Aureimonas endophytica]GGE20548.1 urease accessory protein UreD [Aureimonas endophytica]